MHVLVGWDDPSEAELIALYLSAGEQNTVHVTTDPADLLTRARSSDDWDIVLMTTSTTDNDAPFETFQEVRKARPECPIVGACRSQDVYRLARFISNGMRSYMLRDIGGDFVFLLQSTLESTLAANRAEREQRMAERMREEIESVRRFQESILPLELARAFRLCVGSLLRAVANTHGRRAAGDSCRRRLLRRDRARPQAHGAHPGGCGRARHARLHVDHDAANPDAHDPQPQIPQARRTGRGS